MDQLARAIGPDRIIVLKPGTYTIAKPASGKNTYVRWEDTGNGVQVAIQNAASVL